MYVLTVKYTGTEKTVHRFRFFLTSARHGLFPRAEQGDRMPIAISTWSIIPGLLPAPINHVSPGPSSHHSAGSSDTSELFLAFQTSFLSLSFSHLGRARRPYPRESISTPANPPPLRRIVGLPHLFSDHNTSSHLSPSSGRETWPPRPTVSFRTTEDISRPRGIHIQRWKAC